MSSILKVSEIQDPTNNNSALTIDSSGRVLTPQTPAILVHGPDNNNITWANSTALNFSTVAGTAYQNGITLVSNTRLTVPVAGVYFISSTVYFNDSSTAIRIQHRKNGSTNLALKQNGAAAGRSVTVTQIVDLAANDYMEVMNYSGGSRTVYNGEGHSYSSMFLIG